MKWVLRANGAPKSIESIAKEARFSARKTRGAIDELIAVGTVIRRADGALGFPNFERWQESPDAARKREARGNRRSARPWFKCHETWWKSRSHDDVSGVALAVGLRMLSIANASPDMSPDMSPDSIDQRTEDRGQRREEEATSRSDPLDGDIADAVIRAYREVLASGDPPWGLPLTRDSGHLRRSILMATSTLHGAALDQDARDVRAAFERLRASASQLRGKMGLDALLRDGGDRLRRIRDGAWDDRERKRRGNAPPADIEQEIREAERLATAQRARRTRLENR